jgi:hypothetical protein
MTLPILPADAPEQEVVRDYPWPGYALWRARQYVTAEAAPDATVIQGPWNSGAEDE